MKNGIIICFILLNSSLLFAQERINAVRFRVTKTSMDTRPTTTGVNDKWDDTDEFNGMLVVLDIKGNKVTTYGATTKDYLITKCYPIDERKKDGYFLLYMETVDKDNRKVIVNFIKYEDKDGGEIYSEMELNYTTFKLKFRLKKQPNQ